MDLRRSFLFLSILTTIAASPCSARCDLSPEEVIRRSGGGVFQDVPDELVLDPLPYSTSSLVPDRIDWRNVNGTDYTLLPGNQMLPSPCGSCWAFGSTGALADRIAILTKGVKFDISPQGLLDCAGRSAGSCDGGSHYLAYAFASNVGLTDKTCLPYRGVDISNWGESPCETRMCRTCDRFGTCTYKNMNETLSVRVSQYGSLKGVDAMKREIAARGPIACSMYAHSEGFETYKGGIIRDTTKYPGTTHVVSVVGYSYATTREEPSGDDNIATSMSNLPYWIVRNSFGTGWGELGYYRVEMGKDIFNMESSNCSWALPDPKFVEALQAKRVL